MARLLVLLLLAASLSAQSDLRQFLETYQQDRGALLRRWDAEYSPTRRARLVRFYEETQAALRGQDFDRLNREGQVDYVLLDHRLTYERSLLDLEGRRAQDMAALVPFAPAVFHLHEQRRDLVHVDGRASADTLVAIARRADSVRAAMAAMDRARRPSRVTALRTAEAVDGFRRLLREWYRFSEGYDPVFTWWTREPWGRADSALMRMSQTIRRELLGVGQGATEPIIGDPIGAEGMRADLAHEMIPYTPQELLAIGEREYAWAEAEMIRASRELGFGDNWRQAVEHVKTLHREPGGQTELSVELAREAEEWLLARELVTIPPLAREVWRMEMLSSERQRVAPFYLGGETILVAFPTDGMTHEEKLMSMRGNNPHFSRAVVHHELIPGHHLQGFMTNRYFPYRGMFGTPFWGEGWALYWEFRLYDLGFPRSAEDRVGMLFWRMHRAARIIFSLKFHLGEMTPQQAIDFLVDRVGHERANAEAEVRRSFNGTYPPLYQAGYMLGGLQIRALHAELVTTGRMTEREFHDAILQGGRMPIAMVRARLSGQALARSGPAPWRF
ncbi:MAG: DUF885 family protein [Gemmatimonadales bacterium]